MATGDPCDPSPAKVAGGDLGYRPCLRNGGWVIKQEVEVSQIGEYKNV